MQWLSSTEPLLFEVVLSKLNSNLLDGRVYALSPSGIHSPFF